MLTQNWLKPSSILCALAVVTLATCFISTAIALDNVEIGRKDNIVGEILPTGMRITPTAANGALFQPLNPDLATRPDYLVDHAVDIAASPDGKTLLILTSGYNV
jgi:formaldehyde-activating enzyme involved in methanogenesis